MGGVVSGRTSKKERRKREFARSQQMADVERFVLNSYAAMNRMDSMSAILSSSRARNSFKLFVMSEKCDEALQLHSGVGKINGTKSSKISAASLREDIRALFSLFIQEGCERQVVISKTLYTEIETFLDNSVDNMEMAKELLECIENEATFVMSRDQFQRFILSKYYKQWRATEASYALAQSGTYANLATMSQKTNTHLVAQPTGDRGRKRSEMALKAFNSGETAEISKLLETESWLAVLLAAIEAVPLAFCIASGDKARRGWPLIYVNRQFETLTGYDRSEVLARNCKFMQCAESEPEKIQLMTERLRAEKQCRVVITNCTSETSGKKLFKNLVVFKPIFDEDEKKILYVVSTMMDATRDVDDYKARSKLAQDLMDMLPNRIIAADEDEA